MYLFKTKIVCYVIYYKFFSWRLLKTEMVNCWDFSEAATWWVVYNGATWCTFNMIPQQKKNPFLYTPFRTRFLVKKRHHRNKYLGLIILNLYLTSKCLYTQHQTFFTIFTIKTKKEQAKKSSQVYMIPYTIINQKGTSNKFVPKIF